METRKQRFQTKTKLQIDRRLRSLKVSLLNTHGYSCIHTSTCPTLQEKRLTHTANFVWNKSKLILFL